MQIASQAMDSCRKNQSIYRILFLFFHRKDYANKKKKQNFFLIIPYDKFFQEK